MKGTNPTADAVRITWWRLAKTRGELTRQLSMKALAHAVRITLRRTHQNLSGYSLEINPEKVNS